LQVALEDMNAYIAGEHNSVIRKGIYAKFLKFKLLSGVYISLPPLLSSKYGTALSRHVLYI